MEAYEMTCKKCGRTRRWWGYKTGIGKTPEQLAAMHKEDTTCAYCGSTDEHAGLDRSSYSLAYSLAASMLLKEVERPSVTQAMFSALHTTESALPRLLRDESRWQSVYVDYHEPYVERVWCAWENARVCLHRIHPCAEGDALMHPHPWPSAMRMVKGRYEMGVGYGAGMQVPKCAATIVLSEGSEYVMVEPDGWHYVRPLDKPSMSLMVSGEPWPREAHKSDKPLRELSAPKKREILEFFRSTYR